MSATRLPVPRTAAHPRPTARHLPGPNPGNGQTITGLILFNSTDWPEGLDETCGSWNCWEETKYMKPRISANDGLPELKEKTKSYDLHYTRTGPAGTATGDRQPQHDVNSSPSLVTNRITAAVSLQQSRIHTRQQEGARRADAKPRRQDSSLPTPLPPDTSGTAKRG